MNVNDNPETVMRYQIRSIPALLLFKGGKVVDQRVGAVPRSELVKMLAPQVESAAPGTLAAAAEKTQLAG